MGAFLGEATCLLTLIVAQHPGDARSGEGGEGPDSETSGRHALGKI